jgi:hypothetical protein
MAPRAFHHYLCAILVGFLCLTGFTPDATQSEAGIIPSTGYFSPSHRSISFFPLTGSAGLPAAYAARIPAGDVLFNQDSVEFRLKNLGSVVDLQAIGASGMSTPTATEPLAGRINLIHGSNPGAWRTNLPTYAGLIYHNLYPGIDLHYSGQMARLKATYVVAPGVAPDVIGFRYSGARATLLDRRTGDLHVTLPGRKALVESAPSAWQIIDGRMRPVAARFSQNGRNWGFDLGAFDPSYPLVIDPALSFSSYYGGTGDDEAVDVALDHEGNILIIGSTKSVDFPTANPLQTELLGGEDVFVMKLNSDGTEVLFATYLGGSANDQGAAIVTDISADGVSEIQDGSLWITGRATSSDFPTTPGAFQISRSGCNGFLAKLTSDGALLYSTYVGGSGSVGYDLAVDTAGNAYITGTTMGNYPIVNGFDATLNGQSDGFVAEFNAAGSALTYSTYLGGDAVETLNGIALSGGSLYITGSTSSATNFPITTGVFQPQYNGETDAFVTRLLPALSGSASLAASTLLGGSLYERADGIALTPAGSICVAGTTSSPNFPLRNAFQSIRSGASDAFLTCLPSSLQSLGFSTLLGGNQFDVAHDLFIQTSGAFYLTGATYSSDFPVFFPTFSYQAGSDAFIAIFRTGGSGLLYSSYLGGELDDAGLSILSDEDTGVFVAGSTESTDFPIAGSSSVHGGGTDAFITLVEYTEPLLMYLPYLVR